MTGRGAVLSGAGVTVRAVASSRGWGIQLEVGELRWEQPRPVGIELLDGEDVGEPYGRVDVEEEVLVCRATVAVEGAAVRVVDRWWLEDGDVHVRRALEIVGTADTALLSRLMLRRADDANGWADVVPFVPGVTYGNATAVPHGALGGMPSRQAGARAVLIREDRAAAPMIVVRYPDGGWLAVLHADPGGATIALDGQVLRGGETLVDPRVDFLSVGGVETEHGLEIGTSCPGTEGEFTYSTGGLPLEQPRAWRRRYHPVVDGMRQDHHLVWRAGSVTGADPQLWSSCWRWAWKTLRPQAATADLTAVERDTMAVLADQVTTTGARTGVPLEVDAVSRQRTVEDTSAVMGFVGANTDAGHLLLRTGDTVGGDVGARYRHLGEQILDSFTVIPLDPPSAEGFDVLTGEPTTYRTYRDRPAVYARSVAEGCLAVLDAVAWEHRHGRSRDAWLSWTLSGARWLVRQQADDGSLPRAWVAGSGEVLDASRNATAVVVPFLVAAARTSGDDRLLQAAVRAGSWAWDRFGTSGSWAGGTLDNPDVVDKEASMLAAEGFLDLLEATGDRVWLERAVSAASVAETWTYVWDVPMPVDAEDAALHWKRGVPTTGHQLITTGASMTDGFLAVNAAAFAKLWRATGDDHWLQVARLVTHGTTTMVAGEGREFDLRGPGWQQEHWCFAGRRGFGLNRRWLPWVPVAHVRGIARLRELGDHVAEAVLARGLRRESES